jgi:hypothetical protein
MAPASPASTIRRAAACAQRKLPLRLTSRTWSQSDSVMSRKSTRGKTPALFTRIAGAPSSRATALTIASASVARATSPDETRSAPHPAELGGDLPGGPAAVEEVDAHVGAPARVRHRDGPADALLGARHQRTVPTRPMAPPELRFSRVHYLNPWGE